MPVCVDGPGYDDCRKLVNERFAKVFYKNNYAHGATIHNLYMAYGKKIELSTIVAYAS